MTTNQFGKNGWTPERIKDLKGKELAQKSIS